MSLYNYDEYYSLSRIVWVKVKKFEKGKQNIEVIPFYLMPVSNIARNTLNNVNYIQKENLTATEFFTYACKREYGENIEVSVYPKVITYKTKDGFKPNINGMPLPEQIVRKHIKEYLDKEDMIISTTEARTLSKYFSKIEMKNYNKLKQEQEKL